MGFGYKLRKRSSFMIFVGECSMRVKERGLAEIAELEALNRRFQEAAENYLAVREICVPHTLSLIHI